MLQPPDDAAALLLTLVHLAVCVAQLPPSSPSAQSCEWAERPRRLWIAGPAQRAAGEAAARAAKAAKAGAAAAKAAREEGEGWVEKAAEA